MRKSGNYLLVSSLACLLPAASTHQAGRQTLGILKYRGRTDGKLVTHSGFSLLCAWYNFFPSKMRDLSFMVSWRRFPT